MTPTVAQPLPNVADLFAGKEPVLRGIYDHLLTHLREHGPVSEEPKKTSIHLASRSGFAGVRVARRWIDLNIRTSAPIESPRARKTEKVSANRYHQEVRLQTLADVDDELLGWLRDAYALAD